MNRTLATVATRFGSREAGGGTATGSARSGSVFPVVGQEEKLELDDAWHWQGGAKEYEHIMTILDRQGGFDQTQSDLAFHDRFPTLEERRTPREKFARKCLNCGEDAYFARDCPKPFINVPGQINPDVGSSNATGTEKKMRTWQARLE